MDSPSPDIKIDVRVGQYVALRDKIKELNDAHKQNMAQYNEALEVLGNLLLAHLNNTNVESARTEHGTFFKTTKKTASLQDPDAFMKFIVEHQLFDLIDRKANVKGVEDYLNTHKALPPGVKYTERVEVNVRRS